MTFASASGLFHFVKARTIELEGKEKAYQRVLLYVTFSKSLPQLLVETSPKQYQSLVDAGLKPGNFLFVQGAFELIQNEKNPMSPYLSSSQKAVVRATPTIKASTLVLQPSGCTPMANVSAVTYITSDLQGCDNRGKSHMVFKDNGMTILNFSGSVRTPYKATEGGQYAPSTFLRLTAFGNKATFIYNYFEKKSDIAVDCRLDLDSWTSTIVNQDTLEETEVTKYAWKLSVNEATFVRQPKRDNNGGRTESEAVVEAVKEDDNSAESDWGAIPF